MATLYVLRIASVSNDRLGSRWCPGAFLRFSPADSYESLGFGAFARYDPDRLVDATFYESAAAAEEARQDATKRVHGITVDVVRFQEG